MISKNFIRLAKARNPGWKDKRPVYATLAVSRNALVDKQELVDFVNEITLLDNQVPRRDHPARLRLCQKAAGRRGDRDWWISLPG